MSRRRYMCRSTSPSCLQMPMNQPIWRPVTYPRPASELQSLGEGLLRMARERDWRGEPLPLADGLKRAPRAFRARSVSAATFSTIGRIIWRSAGSPTGDGWQPAIFSSVRIRH